jgi:hypothetical protein
MKTQVQLPSSRRKAVGNPKAPGGHDDSSYISAEATRALLQSSLAVRNARLAADDMLSTDAAAELVGVSRVTINAWIAKGRAIGLSQAKRGFRMPRWQFEPVSMPVVPKVAQALGTTDGWALLAFFESPRGALNGATPRVAIERGQVQRVLEIAEHEGN